jgi:tetratricopeptide (TPR) repeat protein
MTIQELEKDFEGLTEEIKELFRDRNRDKFLQECELFIESHPYNKSIYVYKGIILEEKGLYEEAIEIFDIVINSCPDFYYVYKFKANCYIQLRSYILARESYKEFLRYNSDNAEAWCFMCLCFYLEGKKEVALGLLDHALGEVTNKSLVSLLKGMLYENEDMDEDALINYVQSQISSKDNEERQIAGSRIFKVMTKEN